MSKYNHVEAYCLMKYESDDRQETEIIWNSRDGVTPFCITAKDGKTELMHADWKADHCVPDHRLLPGDRYFADLALEKAKQYATDRLKAADGTDYEVQGEERARLHGVIVESMMRDGAPDVLTFEQSTSEQGICDHGGVMATDERPWFERKLSRFFSWHPCGPELPEWAKDGLTSTTVCNLSWKDRLRVLLTGNVSVRTWIACENPPGRHETSATVSFPLRLP